MKKAEMRTIIGFSLAFALILATTTLALTIGGKAGTYFNGTIDEVAIYNYSLSADDVQNRYFRGLNIKFQARSCDDLLCLGEQFSGPDNTNSSYFTNASNNNVEGIGNISNNTYFQFKVFFETPNASYKPYLEQTSLSYSQTANNPPDVPVVTFPTTGSYASIPYINYSSGDQDNNTIVYDIYINQELNISRVGYNITALNASDGTYNLTVSAWDGSDFSANSTRIEFTIDSSVLVLENLEKNTTPFRNGSLRMNSTITGCQYYAFFWNDSGVLTNDTSNLCSSNPISTIKNTTTPHQNICWGYWANNSAGQTNTTPLDCFTVNNTLPQGAVINITTNTTLDTDLSCNITVAPTDIDNDTIQYIFNWYKNDVLHTSSGLTGAVTSNIGAQNTSTDEVWNCTVIVNDGYENTTPFSQAFSIIDSTPNASFDGSYNTSINHNVTINASSTFDYDHDDRLLTFTWNLGDGSPTREAIGLSGINHNYTVAGTYTVVLTVSDGIASDQISTQILVANINTAANDPPTAHAGSDQSVMLNASNQTTIQFNASLSNDPDENALNYSWSNGLSGVTPTKLFTDAGSYTVEVTVTDGNLSDADTVSIIIASYNSTENDPPVANAGPDQDTSLNSSGEIAVNFDASLSSDPDGDSLTYTWSNGLTGVSPTYIYNKTGTYAVTLTVSDGSLQDTDSMLISINDTSVISVDSNVSDTEIDNATVDSSVVEESNLTDSQVNESTVDNSNISSSTVTNATINSSIVESSNVSEIISTNSTLNNSEITNTNVSNSIVENTQINESTIDDSNITQSLIINVSMNESTVDDSNITAAIVTNTTINNSEIINSNISGSDLQNVSVNESVIENSNLTQSTASNSTVQESTTVNANLTDSTVNESVITSSNITSSDLSNATINISEISNSNISDTLVQNATINTSEVFSTNITESVILNTTANESVITDSNLTQTISQNSTINSSEVLHSNLTDTTATESTINASLVGASNVTDSSIDTSEVNESTIVESNITSSEVINTSINGSVVENSNITASNVQNTTINLTAVDNSNITISDVQNSTVNFSDVISSNLTQVTLNTSTVNNSNVTATDASNSTLQDSVIMDSDINNSIILNTTITTGQMEDCHINNSDIMGNNMSLCTILDSTINETLISNANTTNVITENVTIENSTVVDSNLTDSVVNNSYVENSNISETILTNVTANNSFIDPTILINTIVYNSTIINSTLVDAIVWYANISNDIMYEGTIQYQGVNYTGSQILSSIFINLGCGDSICQDSESCSSCPIDCGACPIVSASGGTSPASTSNSPPVKQVIDQEIRDDEPTPSIPDSPSPPAREEVDEQAPIVEKIVTLSTDSDPQEYVYSAFEKITTFLLESEYARYVLWLILASILVVIISILKASAHKTIGRLIHELVNKIGLPYTKGEKQKIIDLKDEKRREITRARSYQKALIKARKQRKIQQKIEAKKQALLLKQQRRREFRQNVRANIRAVEKGLLNVAHALGLYKTPSEVKKIKLARRHAKLKEYQKKRQKILAKLRRQEVRRQNRLAVRRSIRSAFRHFAHSLGLYKTKAEIEQVRYERKLEKNRVYQQKQRRILNKVNAQKERDENVKSFKRAILKAVLQVLHLLGIYRTKAEIERRRQELLIKQRRKAQIKYHKKIVRENLKVQKEQEKRERINHISRSLEKVENNIIALWESVSDSLISSAKKILHSLRIIKTQREIRKELQEKRFKNYRIAQEKKISEFRSQAVREARKTQRKYEQFQRSQKIKDIFSSILNVSKVIVALPIKTFIVLLGALGIGLVWIFNKIVVGLDSLKSDLYTASLRTPSIPRIKLPNLRPLINKITDNAWRFKNKIRAAHIPKLAPVKAVPKQDLLKDSLHLIERCRFFIETQDLKEASRTYSILSHNYSRLPSASKSLLYKRVCAVNEALSNEISKLQNKRRKKDLILHHKKKYRICDERINIIRKNILLGEQKKAKSNLKSIERYIDDLPQEYRAKLFQKLEHIVQDLKSPITPKSISKSTSDSIKKAKERMKQVSLDAVDSGKNMLAKSPDIINDASKSSLRAIKNIEIFKKIQGSIETYDITLSAKKLLDQIEVHAKNGQIDKALKAYKQLSSLHKDLSPKIKANLYRRMKKVDTRLTQIVNGR